MQPPFDLVVYLYRKTSYFLRNFGSLSIFFTLCVRFLLTFGVLYGTISEDYGSLIADAVLGIGPIKQHTTVSVQVNFDDILSIHDDTATLVDVRARALAEH